MFTVESALVVLPPRLSVTFRSFAFNTAVPEKHFVSRRPYGSDLANWLVHQLAGRDVSAFPMIGQKDAGWLIRFRLRGTDYDFVVRYQDPDWLGSLELTRTLLGRLLRKPPKSVAFDAVALIHSVLSSSEAISDIRWTYADSLDPPIT